MNKKPTILVFIDWYKPAYKAGGPITSCVNLIDSLKGQFHFKVFTSCFDYLENAPLEGIASNQWIASDGVEVFYSGKENQTRKFAKNIIQNTPHDQLWINGIFSPIFSIAPLIYRDKSKPCVVSARGMLGKNVLQFKSKKKIGFLRFAKLMKWHKGVRFHATNQSEVKDIKSVFPKNEVLVAPNVPSQPKSNLEPITKEKRKLKILQVARIAKEKNTLFGLEILKNMKGEVELDIVGSVYDKSYGNQCKELAKLFGDNIKVKFLGSKSPFDLKDMYSNYHVFFLPTLGENYGHAIVESLSYGLPNIISDQTIWRDLEKENAGFDLPLNEETFAKSLQMFVEMDEEEFKSWRNGAKNYFNKKVNWSEILDQNKTLFHFE